MARIEVKHNTCISHSLPSISSIVELYFTRPIAFIAHSVVTDLQHCSKVTSDSEATSIEQ